MTLPRISIPWKQLTLIQKISIAFLLFFLLVLPLAILAASMPVRLQQRAQVPATPPVTPTPMPGFGQAIRLNGINSYVTVTQSFYSLPDVTKEFTLEAYVKVLSYDLSPLGNNPILTRAPGSEEPQNYSLSIIETSSGDYLAFDLERPGYPDLSLGFHGNTNLKTDKWYHVVIQRGGMELKLFVDGTLDGTTTISADSLIMNIGDKLVMGASWGSITSKPDYYSNMEIDEVRISDIARYSSSFTPPGHPFIPSDGHTFGLWHFDGDVLDYSGKDNYGTIVGDAQFTPSTIPVPTPTFTHPISPTPTPRPPTPTSTSTPTPTLRPTITIPTPTPACIPYACKLNTWSPDQFKQFVNNCFGSSTTECLQYDRDCNRVINIIDVQYIAGNCVVIPSPTPTPTPKPYPTIQITPTPTPTPLPNQPPIIKTASFPTGRLFFSYSALIEGEDINTNDNLTMSIGGLPSGIRQGPCGISTQGNIKRIRCLINGRPTRSGTFPITINLRDNRGGASQKVLPLRIYGFLFR